MVSKLIRRTHMYLALFLTPWMLMYALSTLAMQHRDLFAPEGAAIDYSVDETTTFDGSFAPDATPQQIGEQLLMHLDMEGVFRAEQSEDGTITVTRFNPTRNRRVTFDPTDKSLVVETGVLPPERALENLHRAHGFDTGIAARTAWAVVVDAVIVAILFWCLSGLWLWWQLKKTRTWGAVCAASGMCLFALFLARI